MTQFKYSTPEQRLELYRDMLKRAEAGELKYCVGFCEAMWEVAQIGIMLPQKFRKYFPELWESGPDNRALVWFTAGDWAPRIKCLEKAIALTEAKINSQNKNM